MATEKKETKKETATKKEPAKKVAPKKAPEQAVGFAVIKTGGKQYVVRKGDVLSVEKLSEKDGKKISFGDVLLIDNGTTTKVGDPIVKGATVEAKLLEHGRGKKLHVIRYRAKSRHFRKYGHRQPYSKVEITTIK